MVAVVHPQSSCSELDPPLLGLYSSELCHLTIAICRDFPPSLPPAHPVICITSCCVWCSLAGNPHCELEADLICFTWSVVLAAYIVIRYPKSHLIISFLILNFSLFPTAPPLPDFFLESLFSTFLCFIFFVQSCCTVISTEVLVLHSPLFVLCQLSFSDILFSPRVFGS